jgi:hypothetical protein
MREKGRLLIGLNLYNNIISAFMRTYFLSYYIINVSSESISIRNSLEPLVGLLIGYFIIKYNVEKINIKWIVLINFIYYPCLILIVYDINAYHLLIGLITGVCGEFYVVFFNRIRSLNIEQDHRIKYNNLDSYVYNIGTLIGSGVSLFINLKGYPLHTTYFYLYILGDIYIIILLICVYKKIIKY